MLISDNFALPAVTWFVVAATILYLRWRRLAPGVGLVAAYIFYFAWPHFVPALVHMVPWYWPLYDSGATLLGFQASLWGLLAFALGVVAFGPKLGGGDHALLRGQNSQNLKQARNIGLIYLLLGIFSYFVLTPLLSSIPTVSAAISVLAGLLYAGASLIWWYSRQVHNRWLQMLPIALAVVWPFVTAAREGFLGFGLILPILLALFAVRQARRHLMLLPVLLLLGYVGVSLSVTYSLQRDQVRMVAWNSKSTLADRISTAADLAQAMQWFNPTSQEHLQRIEMHTNQNWLVGLMIERLDNHSIDYAHGATLADALIMLVPRAAWPEKPVRVGGSSYITQYTGVVYSGSTTVAMGQTMEFYVNFGVAGLIVGFLLLGTVLAVIDAWACRALNNSEWTKFALWYSIGISMLQTWNNLLTIVGGAAATWLVITLLNKLWLEHNRTNELGVLKPNQNVRTFEHRLYH